MSARNRRVFRLSGGWGQSCFCRYRSLFDASIKTPQTCFRRGERDVIKFKFSTIDISLANGYCVRWQSNKSTKLWIDDHDRVRKEREKISADTKREYMRRISNVDMSAASMLLLRAMTTLLLLLLLLLAILCVNGKKTWLRVIAQTRHLRHARVISLLCAWVRSAGN